MHVATESEVADILKARIPLPRIENSPSDRVVLLSIRVSVHLSVCLAVCLAGLHAISSSHRQVRKRIFEG